jgi:zinc transport system substrate-binding protein
VSTYGAFNISRPPAARSLLTLALIAAGLLSTAALPACDRAATTPVATPEAKRPLALVATIAPLSGIIKELAPPDATVTMLMQPGRSEHGYEFTPSDIQIISRADAVFYVGLGLEPTVSAFLDKRPSPSRQAISLGRVLKLEDPAPPPHQHKPDEPAHKHDDHDHDDHDHHGHDHGPIDVHLWLDPVLMLEAIPALNDAIITSLKRTSATDADLAVQNARAAALTAKLQQLDSEIKSALAPYTGRAIVTHHAAFGRFADRYGLRVAEVLRPIETSEPTPGQLSQVAQAIRKENIKTIFIEPQFDPAAAQRVATLAGVSVVTLDPLGTGDYFQFMRSNLLALIKGLGPESTSSPLSHPNQAP